MSLKSISSFLASILLIGFTISTGIIVYYFVSTLPRTQTQQVSSQASKVLSCAGATFDVKVKNCNLLNGLVLWLPMDEGSGTIAYDYSGYGNNGTLYNGTNICSNPPTPGCPTWVDGKFGKALSFDGDGDYITGTSIFNFNTFTLVAWINPNVNPNPSSPSELYRNYGLFSFGSRNIRCPYFNYVCLFEDNTKDAGWKSVAIGSGYFLNNPAPPRFHFVSLKFDDNSKTISVRWNESYFQSSFNYVLSSVTSGWVIGRWGQGYFNGTIDELRFYNRALSDDEIKQLYYNGLTNKFNITIGLLNSGFADLGNSFTAIVYLKNGTILQLPLVLDNNLSKGYYLEKTLTIDGYYPSYGLIDKIMVCSNDCQGVCSEIKINNQC